MYVIDYLAGKHGSGEPVSEYRLLCSGEVFNGKVLTSEHWRKSEPCRYIVEQPCVLVVVSRPFNDYPQELCLRISVGKVEEVDKMVSGGLITSQFRPDNEIAQDLAVLLTVFLRRLVTVFVKVREVHPKGIDGLPGSEDLALPITNSMTKVAWKRRAVLIGSGVEGVRSVIDYNPPPLEVDPEKLGAKLFSLPNIRYAESYILAARLYSQAMRVIEESPNLAYQSLISSIETLANKALSRYVPSSDVMVTKKKAVVDRAIKMGLTEENAKKLGELACKDEPWISRKFVLFLMKMVDGSLEGPDSLFQNPLEFEPTRGDYGSAFKNIYNERGRALHEGQPWSPSAQVVGGPMVSEAAMHDLFSGNAKVPPVTWFERVVNLALNRYLDAGGGNIDIEAAID